MQSFAIILLGICVVSAVSAADDTTRSTYDWMKQTLYNTVCQFDEKASQSKVCLDKWTRFGSSCYLFVTAEVDFHQAQEDCKEYDAHLVSINSNGEQVFIEDHVTPLKAINFWIGLEDIVNDGDWKWTVTGEELQYLNWASNEPNGGSGENCAAMEEARGNKWVDVPCNARKYSYVCEK